MEVNIRLGVNIKQDELQYIHKVIDSDGIGEIQYETFANILFDEVKIDTAKLITEKRRREKATFGVDPNMGAGMERASMQDISHPTRGYFE